MFGAKCKSSHSSDARRPPCRFYQQGKCTKGQDCVYLHDDEVMVDDKFGSAIAATSPMKAIVPLLPELSLAGGPLAWFKAQTRQLLLLGEGNFDFTLALQRMHLHPFISSTYGRLSGSLQAHGFMEALDATRIHMDYRAISPNLRSFAWNFPYTGGILEEDQKNETLLSETFLSLSLLLENAWQLFGLNEFTFAVSLQGDQFSRWSVMKSAWRTGWQLIGFSAFDHTSFSGYCPSRHNGDAFPAENPRFYVFSLKKS